MLVNPKIDKLSFTIDKRSLLSTKLTALLEHLEGNVDVTFNNSPNYITCHIIPTKLKRPEAYYEARTKHNLQMNTGLILKFFADLEKFSVFPHMCNITNLHITKDRIVENTPEIYYTPLVNNQTQYKGIVQAYEVNNGTTPSVHICNKSSSMKRGTWLIKFYDKATQLKDHLKVDEIVPLEQLSTKDIKTLRNGYSKYTSRINLDKVNLLRCEIELKNNSLLLFPHSGNRLRVMDIITMIKNNTLYAELNKVYIQILQNAIFPKKKEPQKDTELDNFLVSGNMSRFDNLFKAMNLYQTYKIYANSVIPKKDMLLNEIYDKFVG